MLWTCGCQDGRLGGGLDLQAGETSNLWRDVPVPSGLGLDFGTAYRLESEWCVNHGAEFCEALLTGEKPAS